MTWLKKFDQSDEEAWPDQKIYLPTLENTLKEPSYTCDIWDTDYNTDNWEPGFMTIFVTWQLIVTLDSIRNSCNVLGGKVQPSPSSTTLYV